MSSSWTASNRRPCINGLRAFGAAGLRAAGLGLLGLGAAGLGDIGQHFPDTDATFKGINSRKLLRTVIETLKSNNYIIGNIDATIICEAPKMKSYINKMVANIADDCRCGLNSINIKATTTEKLGFIGRAEGIAAQAICLIETA